MALTAFGVAMSDYSKVAPKTGFREVMSSLYDGIIGFFGGEKELIPYDDINKFASTPLDMEGIKKNALAVSTFDQAFSMFALLVPRDNGLNIVSKFTVVLGM